jgi:hypothetical protein
MASNDSEPIAALLSACRLLLHSILTRTRTEDDAGAWTVRLRAAKKHVDQAILGRSLEDDAVQRLQGDRRRVGSLAWRFA